MPSVRGSSQLRDQIHVCLCLLNLHVGFYQLCILGSLVSLGPCKHKDAGLHSEKVGRDSAPFSESPFLHCSSHTSQLHSFQHLPTLSTPSGPGVTQLWSSAPLARFPRMSWPAQARTWEESQRHLVLYYLRTFNLCQQMETTWGSRDRHLISTLQDLRNLRYFVPNLWTEPSGWRVPSMIVLFILLSWFLNYAHSSLDRNPVLLPSHKLMG